MLVAELVKRDFRQKYAESYLGVFWIFFQPLAYVTIIFFVFTYGLRMSSRGDVPFVSYLLTGITPWMYISDYMNNAPGIVKQYSFLIKKAVVRLSILPLVKIISSIIPHLALVVISVIVVLINGKGLGVYLFQLTYYMLCMMVLMFAIGLVVSSVNLFLPDIAKLMSIIVQFGFWLTPILWNPEMVPEKYLWVINLNPAEYIITGYRDSLLYDLWFIQKPLQTLYFWGFTLTMLFAGVNVFSRLRPHFAEVV